MHQGLLGGAGAVLNGDLKYDYSGNRHHLQLGTFDMLFWGAYSCYY